MPIKGEDRCNEMPVEEAEGQLDDMFWMVVLELATQNFALLPVFRKQDCRFYLVSLFTHLFLSFLILLQISQLEQGSLQTAPLSCHLNIFQYVSLRTLAFLLQRFWYLRNWFLWNKNYWSLWYKISLTSDWNYTSIKNKLTQPVIQHTTQALNKDLC